MRQVEPVAPPREQSWPCGCVALRQQVRIWTPTRRSPRLTYRTVRWVVGPCDESNHDGLTPLQKLPDARAQGNDPWSRLRPTTD